MRVRRMKKKLYVQKWGENALKDKKLVRDINKAHELLDDSILRVDRKETSSQLNNIASALTKCAVKP